jgi:hypothetical protein
MPYPAMRTGCLRDLWNGTAHNTVRNDMGDSPWTVTAQSGMGKIRSISSFFFFETI